MQCKCLRCTVLTIDLALIHREAISGADSTPGTTLVKKIKADALHADLAIIFSSSQWGENEFAVHQNSPEGVNAYLKFPFGETEIIQLINQVFGGCHSAQSAHRFSEALLPN